MKDKILKSITSFFIVMFCCTLIARGASSMTVAKVTTDSIKKGILHKDFREMEKSWRETGHFSPCRRDRR